MTHLSTYKHAKYDKTVQESETSIFSNLDTAAANSQLLHKHSNR